MNFAYFAWPLGRRFCRPLGRTLGITLATGASAMLAPKRGFVRADDTELTEEERRTVELFKQCSGSVVHINTFANQKALIRGTWGLSVDLQEIPQGTGSGFLWDKEHIVTNYHVIKDADRATVTFADHSVREALLVGAEPDCDLAVLKCNDRPKVPALEPGTSSKLQVGQKVFAIGNPFGLDQTLTNGIISGLGREMRGVTGRMMRGLVQTDAAINPGNSGGPLLDARGRFIGVNTMIASPSGAFAGVGFAIPSDTVNRIVTQIIKYGHAKHAWMGIYLSMDQWTEKLSRSLERQGMPRIQGALVLNVEPGSPAELAGLRPTLQSQQGILLGDEILAVDGKEVKSSDDIAALVDDKGIGETVEVTFLRRQRCVEKLTTKLTLTERPKRTHVASTARSNDPEGVPVARPKL